jgi:hypothetical protein
MPQLLDSLWSVKPAFVCVHKLAMAMYDDDNLGGIFPTRTGASTGGANERKMLDSIGGSEGFRTQRKTNSDGSVTMLRTRNGMPEFSRTTVVEVFNRWIEKDFLLRVPLNLDQRVSPGYGLEAGYTAETPLLDSKLLQLNDPHGENPSNTLFHALPPPTENPLKFSTDGFSSFYPRRIKSTTAIVRGTGTTLTFEYDHVQTYFDELHTALTLDFYTADDVGKIATRVYPAKTVAMVAFSMDATLFLKQPTLNVVTKTGITQFDDIVAYGQPWHGLVSDSGLTLENGQLLQGWSNPQLPYRKNYMNDTCYIKLPSASAPAETQDEVAAGITWKDFVLLPSRDRLYGPFQGFNDRWVHFDEDGRRRLITVSVTAETPQFSTGLVTLKLYEMNTPVFEATLQWPTFPNISSKFRKYYDHVAERTDHDLRQMARFIIGAKFRPNMVSPDTKKCLVRNDTYFNTYDGKYGLNPVEHGMPSGAVEVTASGGANGGALTFTWRYPSEIEDAYVGTAYGTMPDPGYIVGFEGEYYVNGNPVGTSWFERYQCTDASFDGGYFHSFPATVNYDKDSNLYVEVYSQSEDVSYVSTSTPREPAEQFPGQCLGSSTYSLSRSFTTKGATYSFESYTANPGNNFSYSGIRYMSVVRASNILTVVLELTFPANVWTIIGAHAYGESVPGLVGTQLVSHSSASHIAYNPGTGEFKIGEEYGYM